MIGLYTRPHTTHIINYLKRAVGQTVIRCTLYFYECDTFHLYSTFRETSQGRFKPYVRRPYSDLLFLFSISTKSLVFPLHVLYYLFLLSILVFLFLFFSTVAVCFVFVNFCCIVSKIEKYL